MRELTELQLKQAASMKEIGRSGLQEHVRRLVKQVSATIPGGLLYYHCFDSRHSPKGFPDVQILYPDGRLIIAELKRESGKVSAEQAEWLSRYAARGQEILVYLWRPRHLLSGAIADVLMGKYCPAELSGEWVIDDDWW